MTTLYKGRKKIDLGIDKENSSDRGTNQISQENPDIKKTPLKWYIWVIIVLVSLAVIGVIIYFVFKSG